jgi:hypothetical protein
LLTSGATFASSSTGDASSFVLAALVTLIGFALTEGDFFAFFGQVIGLVIYC